MIEGIAGPVVAVVAPCWGCGASAEGRVSSKDVEQAERIAEIWKEEIICGATHLYCAQCHKQYGSAIVKERLNRRQW